MIFWLCAWHFPYTFIAPKRSSVSNTKTYFMEIIRCYKGLEALGIESAASKVRLYDGLELESRSRIEKSIRITDIEETTDGYITTYSNG